MPQFIAEVEIWCSCGNGLCSQTEAKLDRTRENTLGYVVEPCPKCQEKARGDGWDQGWSDCRKHSNEEE